MEENPNPFAAPIAHDDPETIPAEIDDPIALNLVRRGLLFVYISICGMILGLIAMAVLGATAGGGGPEAVIGVFLSVSITLLGLYTLQLVGIGLCLHSPAASRARPMAVASLVLQVASLGIGVGSAFLLSDPGMSVGVQALTNLMWVAAVVCFLLCMWRLADHIKRPDVANRAKRTLVTGTVFTCALIAGVAAAGFGTEIDNESLATAGGICLVVSMLGLLIAFLMYANTVTYLRKAIGEAISAISAGESASGPA